MHNKLPAAGTASPQIGDVPEDSLLLEDLWDEDGIDSLIGNHGLTGLADHLHWLRNTHD